MKTGSRKAAVTAYRERKVTAGIYAVRCAATGQRWVGRAPDLSTIQNRLWFTLRHGNNPLCTLQAAWREHGADSLSFDVLEALDEEADPYFREQALKDRQAHWRRELNAETI